MNPSHLQLTALAICAAALSPFTSHAQRTLDLWRGDSLVIGWYDDYPAKDSAYMVTLDDDHHTFRNDSTVVRIFWDSTMSRIASEMKTRGDSVYTSFYYREGQLLRRNIEDRMTMVWLYTEEYHPNGQLHYKQSPSSGSLQHVMVLYPSGVKERELWWNGGRAFNEFTEWYEDGQVKLEAHYEPWPIQEPPYRQSRPIGEWHYYKANGDLEKVEVYEEGVLKETKTK